jgi:hypothetical protein
MWLPTLFRPRASVSSRPARFRPSVERLEDRTVPSLTFDWAFRFGSTGVDAAGDIATDSTGNVYVSGQSYGTVDFDPGPGTVNLDFGVDGGGFVAKYSATGSLVWAIDLGTSVLWSSDLDLDGSGNVYVTGKGVAGGYVTKLDSSGNILWTQPLGKEAGFGLAADGSGVYVAGILENPADFGLFGLTPSGSANVFVVKLDANGNLVWARSTDRGGLGYDGDLALDSAGNVYASGAFSGSTDFDPGKGTAVLTSAGSYDVFVWKLTSAGNFANAVRMGGASYDRPNDIAVDGANNVYSAGFFAGWSGGTADFDPGPATFNLTSAGANDGFVCKLTQPSPLLAAGGTRPGGSAVPLTDLDLQPLVAEARARWQLAGIDTAALGPVEVRIADLPGATLGQASGNALWLDANAAGWGWFIDPTPWEDSEFTMPGDQGEQDRMDLLTVLMHEIGHLLGHDHDEGGLMAETLTAGTRPAASHVPDPDTSERASDALVALLAADDETPWIGSRLFGRGRQRR